MNAPKSNTWDMNCMSKHRIRCLVPESIATFSFVEPTALLGRLLCDGLASWILQASAMCHTGLCSRLGRLRRGGRLCRSRGWGLRLGGGGLGLGLSRSCSCRGRGVSLELCRLGRLFRLGRRGWGGYKWNAVLDRAARSRRVTC